MSEEDWAARQAGVEDRREPDDPDTEENLDSGMPAELAGVPMAKIIAGAREVSAAQARAEALAGAGLLDAIGAQRRGPGYSGPMWPGEYANPTAALANGGALDTAPPRGALVLFLEDAAGTNGTYRGASADEVMGAICAWDRQQAYATARKYQAIAAFIRRRPGDGCQVGDESEADDGCRSGASVAMPRVWEEFAPTELAHSLADSRPGAEMLLETSHDLAVKLPGTMAALLAGVIRDDKARIIVRATANLDPAEAMAAEAKVLDRAGVLTPGGLRAAIARAVMEVAPEKARERRAAAAKTRRVEIRSEESGNSSVAARELSPELALAIGTDLAARARELKKYGIGEDSGDRQTLALLEKFGLAGDLPGSTGRWRPAGNDQDTGNGQDASNDQDAGNGQDAGTDQGAGKGRGAGNAAAVPGRLNLTVPLGTLQGLHDRPGELAGHGPVDAELARRLADAALAHAGTRVCLTVTNEKGQMAGHGCARRLTQAERRQLARFRNAPGHHKRHKPGQSASTGPPGGAGGGNGFTLTPLPGFGPARQLNSGYGTWLLNLGGGGPELVVTIWLVSTDPCDHRMEAARHDPGVELRHVTNLRYATCTGPVCRRPAAQSDFEHNQPHDQDGKTCLCNGNPKCRFEHRLKQDPRWRVDQLPDGRIEWVAPTGRKAITEPHRYPV